MTIEELLKGWSKEILGGYMELGQKVRDEKDFKDLNQYCEEGVVTGLFDSNATREVIEPWLSGIAEMVNERYRVQVMVDNLVVANLKKIEE